MLSPMMTVARVEVSRDGGPWLPVASNGWPEQRAALAVREVRDAMARGGRASIRQTVETAPGVFHQTTAAY